MNTNRRSKRSIQGFTLIEILIVIGMLAVLATVVLVAINPLRQFAQARNSQRQANVSALLNAVGNRIADNRGIFTDTMGSCTTPIPTNAATLIKNGGGYDLRPCLVPDYISELPYDPAVGTNQCTTDSCTGSTEGYDTGYTIQQDATTARITICAPGAAEPAIPDSAPVCLTR